MASVPAEAVLAVLKQLSHDIRGAAGGARQGVPGRLQGHLAARCLPWLPALLLPFWPVCWLSAGL